MIKQVERGEYLLGELIEPKTYEKLVLDKDGTLKKENFTLHARKIPINDIRKRMFETHKKHGTVYYIIVQVLFLFTLCLLLNN